MGKREKGKNQLERNAEAWTNYTGERPRLSLETTTKRGGGVYEGEEWKKGKRRKRQSRKRVQIIFTYLGGTSGILRKKNEMGIGRWNRAFRAGKGRVPKNGSEGLEDLVKNHVRVK